MKPYFHTAARVLLFIGSNLLAGSALAFAALNQGVRVQDGAFFYWQRYFVDNIVATATLPGIALLVGGSLLLCLAEIRKKHLLLLTVSLAVAANSLLFILPASHQASALAFQAARPVAVSAAFTAAKNTEDRHGALNGVLLLVYLAVFFARTGGRKAG